MKRQVVSWLVLLIISLVTVTGCTDSIDINDLALVMAIGVDTKGTSHQVEVTAQIARPADAVGQTGAPTGGTGEPTWTAKAQGRSLFEAMRNLMRYASRRIYFAHNKVIVFSEAYARQGLADAIDFFSRNHELRMRTWVAITPKKASDLVATKTGMQVIPADSIEKMFRYSGFAAKAPRINLMQLEADLLSPTSDPVLPKVDLLQNGLAMSSTDKKKSETQVELAGAGIFERDRFRGWLTNRETQGLLWFISPPHSRVYVFGCPTSDQKVSVEIKKYHFTLMPKWLKNRLSYDVSLDDDAQLVEVGCRYSLFDPGNKKAVEQQVNQRMATEIRQVWRRMQKEKLDFLRLGDHLKAMYPWRTESHRDDFDQLLPSIQLTLHIHTQLRSAALLQQPMTPGNP